MGSNQSVSREDSMEKIANILKDPKSKVLFFVGAGISATSDGEPLIPDFRSPGTGLFYNLAKLDLPTPESVFDIDFFSENPQPFYSLCKDLHPTLVKFPPTRFHYFMKLTNDHNQLIRIFSQNIDTLERATGLDSDKIIEAHGSFAEEFCIECDEKAQKEHFEKQLLADEIPKCEHCEGILKPGIVFYGEQLPDRFHECSDTDLTDDVDLCIFAGTSLNVYPFAGLASDVSDNTLRVLINRERAGDFMYNPRKSDILLLEDCDKIVDEIAELCGWKDELDKLVDQHKKERGQHAKTAKEMVEDMKKDKKLDNEIKESNSVIGDLVEDIGKLKIKNQE
ncbi:histone deacetylase [Saccharomycopsis crataegensis]|uniref:NAD-dependent protein deacetylase n=1 Tax=Saccharomycopsis crataegensis TaxID=43959 RepID=A0AAV5QUU5_9ASCO|nr:histone deacetylase [Saccharomycopsis crataegensis]